MEVQLDKRYPVAVPAAQAWAVLSDIRAVAACMPGAQITEQTDETHYKGSVKSKVGPAVMTFNGDIELLGLDAGERRLELLGKGADRSGSSAAMRLAARLEDGDTPGACVLAGLATVTVSGKLAQFGGRLLVPVADAMLAQFADNFRVAAAAAAPTAAPVADTDTDTAAATGNAGAPAFAATPAAAPAAPVARDAPAPLPMAPPAGELNALALMWLVVKSWLSGLFGRKAG